MSLIPGRPAPRTWPSSQAGQARTPHTWLTAQAAVRPAGVNVHRRTSPALRRDRALPADRVRHRVRAGQAGILAPAARPEKERTWRLAIGRWLMYIYDMKKRSMQEPTFLILTALAAGPQHGYGIITDAERISGGVTRLQTGTLYMALDRLRSASLVEPDREEIADGRLRRYYRLTDEGATLLGGRDRTPARQRRRRGAAAARAARRRHRVSAGGTGRATGAGGDMPAAWTRSVGSPGTTLPALAALLPARPPGVPPGGDARRAAGRRPARAAHAGPGASGEPGRLRPGDPGTPDPRLAGRRRRAGRPGRREPDRPGGGVHPARPGTGSDGCNRRREDSVRGHCSRSRPLLGCSSW